MAMYTSDTVYEGEETIVVSYDIGTTHSAVTLSHVYPGDKPDVRSVLKWPGQEDAAGDSKIPTILAYQNGEVKFCGAEALEYIDDNDYQIARWFKLHLHPESMKMSDQPPAYSSTGATFEIPDLPRRVDLEKIYVDFLQYIHKAARAYFEKSTPNGANIWRRLQSHSVTVLCTPNGWDNAQYSFLRRIAIKAGLVNEGDADARLEFITEGEASVHYALAHTKSANWLEKGTMFTVTDAGGSTVDSTLYECKSKAPLVLEEVCASECVQAGGVFVDRAAQVLLKEKLAFSRFGSDDWTAAIVRSFEKKTKRIFDGSQTSNVLHFGGPGDTDRPRGILKGKLSLSKDEVSSTFEDVVTRTVGSCLRLLQGRKIQHLLLVGGFGESPYLRERLGEMFHEQGTEVVVVDEPSKKAAAEGATIWFIKQLVKARAARCTYGMQIDTPFVLNLHRERQNRTRIDQQDGQRRIEVFDPFIKKDFVLSKDWEKSNVYAQMYESIPVGLGDFSADVYAWELSRHTIWIRDLHGELLPGMRRLCTIRADMSGLRHSLAIHTGPRNNLYWRLDFEVAMSFKRGKLQAKIKWKENGQAREGPVTILPESTF